ncbi:MAG: hypothetical protein ACLQNE_00595 [Thermoguttaceae bacterium]
MIRYRYALKIRAELTGFDLVVCTNANLQFVRAVAADEVMPDASGLAALRHPGYIGAACGRLPYERDPRSRAYVPFGQPGTYFQCCFLAGHPTRFLRLCQAVVRECDRDRQNGIFAVWFDESQANRYFLDHPPRPLDPSYGWPQDWPGSPRIVQLDKAHFGGHEHMRGCDNVNLPGTMIPARLPGTEGSRARVRRGIRIQGRRDGI